MHVRLCSMGCVPVHLQPAFHWQPIRVVGSKGKRCTVDPVFPCQEASLWRLWIWEGRPLAQLVWDLGEWLWPPGWRGEESPFFFEYTAQIGRRIMLCLQSVPHYLRRLQHWLTLRISHVVQGNFGRLFGACESARGFHTS